MHINILELELPMLLTVCEGICGLQALSSPAAQRKRSSMPCLQPAGVAQEVLALGCEAHAPDKKDFGMLRHVSNMCWGVL